MPVGGRSGSGQVRVYRAEWFLRLAGGLGVAGFFVVGLSMVVSFFTDAKSVGGVSGLVLGLLTFAVSVWLSWILRVNCLVASADGVAFFAVFRRRRVPWGAVAGFGTDRSDGMVGWPCVVMRLDERGGREVKQVIGTRRRAEWIVGELEEALRLHREGDGTV